MAAKDLITLARAKQNIQSITDTSQDALLTTLITAISDGIEKYCRRDFYARSTTNSTAAPATIGCCCANIRSRRCRASAIGS